MARLIAQLLAERFNQQIIVENRTGGGSSIAAEAVVRAPPDGYTLLLASIANAANATLLNNLIGTSEMVALGKRYETPVRPVGKSVDVSR